MRREFCTITDVNYLPRALVLYRSLVEVGTDFRLRIFCMDRQAREVLEALALPALSHVALDQLEAHDPELSEVRASRSHGEYCWTATPAACLYVLDSEPDLGEITYLDADLVFYSDPEPLFDELGDGSVLIVPHRYASRLASKEALYGSYNVGFNTFRRTPDGLDALRWWRERCLEWCYGQPDRGRYADQGYLNDWPQRFRGVHVLQNVGGGLAPWNAERYDLTLDDGAVHVDGRRLVFHHFAALEIYREPWAVVVRAANRVLRQARVTERAYGRVTEPVRFSWSTSYLTSPLERSVLWQPYAERVAHAIAEVQACDPSYQPRFDGWPVRYALRPAAGRAWSRVRGARDDAAT